MGEGLLERERELEALERACARASGGTGAVVVVEGPAGIGKSHLLAEARRRCEGAGVAVLAGRGGELERDHPYGVVRQLFEPHLRRMGDEVFEGAAAHAAAVLGRGDGEASGFAVLHGLYWLTVSLAERDPLCLVVDDAHWADQPSLRWLAYLARRLEGLGVAVVVGTRTVDDPALGEIAAEPGAEVLRPSPLSEAGTAALVRARLGADDAFCRACHEAAGGNPFLIGELVGAVEAEGIEPVAAQTGRVRELGPDAVARAVGRRLQALPPEATALAEAVAVLGTDVEVRLAASMASVDEAAALRAADALADAQILGPGRPLEFVHPIVRAAVRSRVGEGERALAHARAARLLSDAGAGSQRVAAQLLEAEPAGDEWVVDALERAASDAASTGALESALGYLRRALDEPPPAKRRGWLLLQTGRVAARLADAGALSYLSEAIEALPDAASRAAAASELNFVLFMSGQTERAIEVLERAIADAGDTDPELVMRLEAELATTARMGISSWPVAEKRLRRFVGVVRGRTPAERMLAANLSARAVIAGESAEEAARLASMAIAGGKLVADQTSDFLVFYQCVLVLTTAERFDEADAALDHALADARARGSPAGFQLASQFRCMNALGRGDVVSAEAEGRAAVEALEGLGYPMGTPVTVGWLLNVLVERGEESEAQALLSRFGLDGDLPDTIPVRILLPTRARLRALAGDGEGALADLQDLARREIEQAVSNPFVVPYRSDLALALAGAGRRDEALPWADAQLALARAWATPGAVGNALRVRALILEDVAGMREAVEVSESSGARLDYARALVDLGSALRRAGERKEAREVLSSGLDVAHRCGGIALAERAREELVVAGARPRRTAVTGPEALTASERRVADMAASGMSNRDIAQALFVTPRTVEVHLTHAYQKLGIGSRAELARALA